MDWPYLRGAVAVFTGATVLSAALLSGSAFYESRMEQKYLGNSDQLRAISRRYLALDEEEDAIKDYFPRFMDLYKTGLLGEEQRLNWVEVLQDAGDRLQLPSLNYEIRAQKPHHARFSTSPGRYEIFVSEMILTMQLLHEGDLFALLGLLTERARGLYTVSGCELKRNFKELTDNPGAGNVAATCLLEWFSIRLKDDPEIKV